METMNIWQLQDYAEYHDGYNSGRFLAINDKGIFEFKWLDAYFGFIEVLQPKMEGFIRVNNLVEIFGADQKYIATIGYDS